MTPTVRGYRREHALERYREATEMPARPDRSTDLHQQPGLHRADPGHFRPEPDLFAALAELSHDLVYVYEIETGRTLYLNRRARDMLGGVGADADGGRVEPVRLEVHPDDLPLVRRRAEMVHAMRDGVEEGAADAAGHELTYRLRDASGAWRWLRGRERPLSRRPDGRARQVLGIAQDITEARERDAALAEAHARFVTLADASPAMLWMGDAEGRIEFCNGALTAYIGMDIAALRSLDWGSLLHPDDLPGERARWADALEAERDYHHRFRLRRHDGAYRWALSHVVPVRDAQGRVARWIGSTTDIHDQVHAEEALRHSVERLRLAIDTSGVVMFSQDADLRYTWIHHPALGYAPEDVIGRTDMDLMERPEDAARLIEIKRRVMRTGRGERHLVQIHQGGAAFWFDLNVHPRLGPDGGTIGVIAACVDVTDMQRAIERREMLLKELNHRIKNSLQLVASLLRLQMAEIEDRTTRSQFERACQRVTAIAELHGRLYMTEDVSSLDFGLQLRSLAPRLVEQIAGRNAPIALEVEADEGDSLTVDQAVPLSLIVNELLTNAASHAFADGREGRIVTGFRVADGVGHFWLWDDGPGLPPTVEERLGLRLVRALVGQIGGRLETGGPPGTRFDIRFRA